MLDKSMAPQIVGGVPYFSVLTDGTAGHTSFLPG
jgi:hypothetical protein